MWPAGGGKGNGVTTFCFDLPHYITRSCMWGYRKIIIMSCIPEVHINIIVCRIAGGAVYIN